MVKGVSTSRSYKCNSCNAKYSSRAKAEECYNQGLPDKLAAGTVFQRAPNEYYAVTFISGRPQSRTHERSYVLAGFPEPVEAGCDYLEGRASFDGQKLHSIRGVRADRGFDSRGDQPAQRVSEGQLTSLMENDPFRKFQEKASAFGKRTRK